MTYYLANGYRLVIPYLHTLKSTVNDGGLKVTEVLLKKWPFLEHFQAEDSVLEGRVLCNGRPVEFLDEVVHRNEIITCTLHYHEPEVLADPIDIIHMSEDTLVVNKPPSIPVYPVGSFRRNNVRRILLSNHPFLLHDNKILDSVHRIDRLASGLLIFARTKMATSRFNKQFMVNSIQKEYVARVKGVFPNGIVEVNSPLTLLKSCPFTYGVSSEGKSAHTVFERESVSPDGTESLVHCRPTTGRSHQIRVHLSSLGHPITNDYKYGGDLQLSKTDRPVPELCNYTKMSWCLDCVLGKRQALHVTTEDRQATHIWLHALRYSSTHPMHQWKFETPLPHWIRFQKSQG